MPEQILLQGKILGTEEFLLAGSAEGRSARSAGEDLLAGRSQWITLLGEVLPRALLDELGLARILLGSSGGGQFLVVLPETAREAAEEFLRAAGRQIADLSGSHVKLIWGITDNLGDWAVIRRRINEVIDRQRHAPLAETGAAAFQPFTQAVRADADSYFAKELCPKVRQASRIGWSPENPGKIAVDEGKHTWPLTSNLSPDGIIMARHAAPSDDGKSAAPVQTLGRRAQGRSIWGVLRGDVDNIGIRIRRAASIEEHIQLSVMYKQFFAGELEVLCSMPEFWRKVSIIYSGGDDFAVYGAWDALIALAREARERAYCPYSNFAVGAAALTASGRVFLGCNVENAAYPATICAERTALVGAYAAGEREIVALAVIADTPGPVSPCGTCRQVIHELAPGAAVVLANLRGEVAVMAPRDLLPGGFDPKDLPPKS